MKPINFLAMALCLAACEHVTVDLNNRPCPCESGQKCDQLTNLCVEERNCSEENDGITIKVSDGVCEQCDADAWIAVDCPGDLCAGINCDEHGTCVSGVCECTDGYTGDNCETPPDLCAGISCGSHGTCVSGACSCDAGWNPNDNCATCDPNGYHPEGQDCVLDSTCQANSCNFHEISSGCNDSTGTIVCICQSEYTGDTCNQCVVGRIEYPTCRDDPCEPDPCNGNGSSCDQSDGTCTCVNTGLDPLMDCGSCKTGWAPVPACNTCANGYVSDGTGGCVLAPTCQVDSCNSHGSCDDSGGTIVCTCDTAYDGSPTCDQCGSGYHWASDGVTCTDDMCDPDPSCDDGLACNGVETCDSVLGCSNPPDVDCNNGTCVEPGTCNCTNNWDPLTSCSTCEGFWDSSADCNACLPNYIGADCHRDWCVDNTCQNGGSCISEACSCVGTWGGDLCELPLVTAELLAGVTYQTMQGSWNTVLYVRATAHGIVTVDGYDHTFSLTDIAPAGTDIANVRIYEGNKVTLISEGASQEVNRTWNNTTMGFSFITPKSMVKDETWDYLVEIEINGFSAGDTITTELVNVRVNTGSNIAVTGVSVALP